MAQLRLIFALVTLATIVGAGWVLYEKGRKDERHEVDGENIEAAGEANDAALSLSDCRDRGWVFHFESGKCSRPSSDNR